MGCLPALIQMPIIIGLYHAISRMNATPAFELRNIFSFPISGTKYCSCNYCWFNSIYCINDWSCNGQPSNENNDVYYASYDYRFGMVLPAALSLYWVVGNIISVIQNIFIYKKPWDKKETEKPATTGGAKK